MAKEKGKGFFAEFKTFITRGNVLDMAVGVIVGGAFTAIVNALSNSILKPIINWMLALVFGKKGLTELLTFLPKGKVYKDILNDAGEVIGILAGTTPGIVRSGMEAALSCLQQVGFKEANGVPYLAHTVSSCGNYLAELAGVPEGNALAYLIAPPLESMYALDAAMKAADVKLCKLYTPPSPTNFGGALLSGSRSACATACAAFATAVEEVAANPK